MVSTKSITFDGVNDYIDLGDVSTFQKDYTDAFSISCWAKTVATASVNTLVGKMDSSGGQPGYLMFLNASGQFEAVLRNTTATNSLRVRTNDSRLNDGGWHHFVMTFDGSSSLLLYVDGVLKTTTTVYNTLSASILVPGKSLQVGSYDGNTAPFAGNIDEVAFFSDDLSAAEVLVIFASARPSDLVGSRALAAWWQMGDNVRFPTVVDRVTSIATYPTISNIVGIPPATTYSPLTTSIEFNNGTTDERVLYSTFPVQTYFVTDGGGAGPAFTMGIWVKFTTTGVTQTLMAVHQTSSTAYSWVIQYKNTRIYSFRGKGIMSYADWLTANLADGSWHLITLSYTDVTGNQQVYIDGAGPVGLNGSGGGGISALTADVGLVIGGHFVSGVLTDPYQGKACHSFIYDKVLSGAEISTIYGFGNPQDLSVVGPTANLIWWSALGDGDAIGSNNILDLSGGGNTGTYVNGDSGDFVSDVPLRTTTDGTMTNMTAANIVQWAPSSNFSRYCYDFDGSNDYITMGNVLGFEYDETFSISCWFKMSSSAGGYLVAKKNTSPTWRGWGFGPAGDGSGTMRAIWGNASGVEIIIDTVATWDDGLWHHVIVTWDGNNSPSASDLRIYVDGLLQTVTVTLDTLGANTIVDTTSLNIGARTNGETLFPGLITEVAIYDKVLSLAEVQWIYNSGLPRDLRLSGAPSNLEAWWRIGEGGEQPQSSWNHKVHNWIWHATATKESATITDASHLNSPGTLYNMSASSVTTDTPGGISGYSCTFNYGPDDYSPLTTSIQIATGGGGDQNEGLTFPSPLSIPATGQAFSIGGWFKRTDATADRTFMGKCRVTSGRNWFLIIDSTRIEPSWTDDAGTNRTYQIASGSWLDGNWHHVVWTYDGTSTHQIYVDGSPISTGGGGIHSGWGSAASDGVFSVGGRWTGASIDSAFYQGRFCHSFLYDKALNSSEVSEVYGRGVPQDLSSVGPTANLKHWCACGDGDALGSGNMVDLSGEGNNGTFVSGESNDFVSDVPSAAAQNLYCNVASTQYGVYQADGGTQLALSAWVKTTASTGWICGNANNYTGTTWVGYGLYLSSGRPQFRLGYGQVGNDTFGSAVCRRGNNTINDGTWKHVLVTHRYISTNNHEIKIWVNGVEQATTLVDNDQSGSFSGLGFSIGALFSTRLDPFAGSIDEVSVWSKFFTQDDVDAVYNSGAPCDLRDVPAAVYLRGWWRMGDAYSYAGTTANMDYQDKAPTAPGTTEYSKYSLTMATNDYVSIPHSADIDFDYDETFSISSWIYPLNLNTYAGIWYKKSGVGLTIEYYGGSGGATYDPRGSIRILFDGTTGLWEVYPGGSWSQLAVPYGEWFHFVMTHDGSSSASGIKCYINGEEVPVWVRYDFAFPGGDTMKNGADLWLGRGGAYWLGNQDEVSAWNKELTPAEVTELYNGGDPGNLLDHSAVANLVGWWQMGDGPGNDGTMTNMASDDVIANAPRKPTVGGTKIDYFLMRGVDSACGTLTYHHWTVTGAPDFTGAQAGTLPCGGPLTDIIVEASWSVFN